MRCLFLSQTKGEDDTRARGQGKSLSEEERADVPKGQRQGGSNGREAGEREREGAVASLLCLWVPKGGETGMKGTESARRDQPGMNEEKRQR